MRTTMLAGTLALIAGSLIAADSSPKDDVADGATKLADSGNYSWTATTDFGPDSRITPSATEGKIDGSGYTWLSLPFNDNVTEVIKKGSKVAVKTYEGWQLPSETEAAAGNPATFIGRRAQNLQPPAAEVHDLLSTVINLKKDGDVYIGDLTERAARERLTTVFRRRRGGAGQGAAGAKGSVKFWIKDGALTKYQTHVTGKREFNGEERDIERTITIEVRDVGSTKVTIPDEAKKKLS